MKESFSRSLIEEIFPSSTTRTELNWRAVIPKLLRNRDLRLEAFLPLAISAKRWCSTHPDSHNFASSADPICRVLSPNLQFLALQRYFGRKEGLNEEQVIRQLALTDAMFDLDTVDKKAIETYSYS